MNNFIVSARKYRPANFKTVVGQDYIVTTLKNAIKNEQLAQAFLFCGPRGVGKTTCARILAKTINCTNITEDFEACNECQSCKSFNESASFNVHELDAASNNSVEDIRTLVDQVRISPQAGKYKIYIIDEVHMLSAAAFNAFLKTLEEPPSYAKFILATTERHKIIPTILSRCQIFDFKRISVEDISKHLSWVAESENVKAEYEALQVIASKSDGALRDALSIFDQMVSFSGSNITYKNVIDNLNILDYEYFFKLVEQVLEQDVTNILLTLNDIYDKGFDGQSVLSGISGHLRNLLICKDKETLPLLEVPHNVINNYKRQSEQCSVNFLIKALDSVNSSDVSYKTSTNKRFHIELAFLKITQFSIPDKKNSTSEPSQQEQKKKYEIASANTPEQNNTKVSHVAEDNNISENVSSSKDNKKEYNVSSSASVSDINVKELMQKSSEEKNEQLVEDKAFTSEMLVEAVKTFIEENNNKHPHLKSIIDISKIEKVSDIQYNISVNGSLSHADIKKADIQTYLRSTLQNRQLLFESVIEKVEENTKIMSREEQVKEFITSNEVLYKFVKDLHLRPE